MLQFIKKLLGQPQSREFTLFKRGAREIIYSLNLLIHSRDPHARITELVILTSATSLLDHGIYWGKETGQQFARLHSVTGNEITQYSRDQVIEIIVKLNELNQDLSQNLYDNVEPLRVVIKFWTTYFGCMVFKGLWPLNEEIIQQFEYIKVNARDVESDELEKILAMLPKPSSSLFEEDRS